MQSRQGRLYTMIYLQRSITMSNKDSKCNPGKADYIHDSSLDAIQARQVIVIRCNPRQRQVISYTIHLRSSTTTIYNRDSKCIEDQSILLFDVGFEQSSLPFQSEGQAHGLSAAWMHSALWKQYRSPHGAPSSSQ
jgi:predicted N-acyltransferase